MVDSSIVVMTIDTRKPRLRIHKATIRQMGNPKFVQLMINGKDRRIALRGYDRHISGLLEFRVDKQMVDSGAPVDWYSAGLIADLCAAFQEIKRGNSYNLTGYIVPSERAAFFDISSLTLIEPNMGELYARLVERFSH